MWMLLLVRVHRLLMLKFVRYNNPDVAWFSWFKVLKYLFIYLFYSGFPTFNVNAPSLSPFQTIITNYHFFFLDTHYSYYNLKNWLLVFINIIKIDVLSLEIDILI